jgi:hypothetical protein
VDSQRNIQNARRSKKLVQVGLNETQSHSPENHLGAQLGVKTMSQTTIETRLDKMPIGMTTTINDKVVTRWAFDSYEIGTWGKSTVNFEQATNLVRQS